MLLLPRPGKAKSLQKCCNYNFVCSFQTRIVKKLDFSSPQAPKEQACKGCLVYLYKTQIMYAPLLEP